MVNVSSLFGLIGPPGQSAYSSSKFALRGFSEVLRHELAPRGIGVTVVHPGGIRTRIAETARVPASASPDEAARGKAAFAELLTYPADKAAARILDGVERRRPRVLVAASAVLPDLLARVTPTGYMRVLGALRPRTARRAPRGSARDRHDAPTGPRPPGRTRRRGPGPARRGLRAARPRPRARTRRARATWPRCSSAARSARTSR